MGMQYAYADRDWPFFVASNRPTEDGNANLVSRTDIPYSLNRTVSLMPMKRCSHPLNGWYERTQSDSGAQAKTKDIDDQNKTRDEIDCGIYENRKWK